LPSARQVLSRRALRCNILIPQANIIACIADPDLMNMRLPTRQSISTSCEHVFMHLQPLEG
jgi:hypothetical protein